MSPHRTIVRLSAVLAAVALAKGCGDGDSPAAPPTPEPARPTTVTVSPATAELTALGTTVQLTAEVRDQNGQVMAGATVTWSSRDGAVATVDAGGLVTGVAEGVATITASAGSGQGMAEITVMDLDRAALVALYEATDGPNWVNSDNWLTNAPLQDWYGVDVDTYGRVVRLDLRGRYDDEDRKWILHGLSGRIPPELSNLRSLRTLDLGYNELSGPIPPGLGDLANLRSLVLNDNILTGPIPPELGNLANLTSLQLYTNDLRGSIPRELGNLGNLRELSLWNSSVTGPIPPELGNLVNLTMLEFGSNHLSGPIPPELGNLVNLTALGLFSNDLSGPIPPELGNLANLTRLWLSSNDLSGPIPQSLLQLGGLSRFRFEGNEGLCVPGTSAFVSWLRAIEDRTEDPESTCNAADVAALNSLFAAAGGTGWTESAGWLGDDAVEEWYGVGADTLGRVTALDLTRNRLVGRLPVTLGDLTQMTVLRIGANALSGGLPLSLTQVLLLELQYAGTELCAPGEEAFQSWLNAIPLHEGTGVECAAPRTVEITSVPTNGGATDGAGTWHVDDDDTLTSTLTASANPGYDFEEWVENGVTISTYPVFDMEVKGHHQVSARFSVNQDRGEWTSGGTYTVYDFPDGEYESFAWTFLPATDPAESLREKGLLHYYAYNFRVLNSAAGVGQGYAGFQSNGLLPLGSRTQWGKVVNFSIWGSNAAKTDGLVNPRNEECGCHQIMYQYEWVEGRAYRFELREGPSGLDALGKWWGLLVTDLVTGSVTFVGEQRVPAVIDGRPSTMLAGDSYVFGEDLHWGRANYGTEKYVCSDFEASSLAVLDVSAGEAGVRPNRVWSHTNGGQTATAENGYMTTICHVTVFTTDAGDAQHNLGFWPEPPTNVLR